MAVGMRRVVRGSLVVGLAAIANTGAAAFLASASRLRPQDGASSTVLSLHSKGGMNLRQGWSLGPDCQKRQMHFGQRDAWGASPVVRLRGGGLGGKADDKDPMLESDANDAVAEDADAEVQVLYKHPRETDAVDAVGSDAKEDEDEYYFNSYSHFGIHEEMLKDDIRTRAYRDSLLKNAHLLKDKIVLDIGCGTGILSMFAAQAGAKHVYAVDMSDIADTAREIVRANGLSDRITVIKGNIEELDLPVDKVDVIVSEWMGYCLLYEAMFDSVLVARDRWLAPGGMLLPDKATMYITAIEDEKYKNEKIHFWDNVYGFNMSCVKGAAMFEPLVDTVESNQICTTVQKIWEADLLTVTKQDLEIEAGFQLKAKRNDYCHALVIWFDVGFTQGHKEIWLSTSPMTRSTHWRQTVVYLHDELCMLKDEEVSGTVRIRPTRANKRHLDLRLNYSFEGQAVNGVPGQTVSKTHYYRMR